MPIQTVISRDIAQQLPSAATWVVDGVCARGIHVAKFFEAATKSACCMCINTPILSVGEYAMLEIAVQAYEFSSGVGSWLTKVYGFLATDSGGALSPAYQHLGNRDRTVRWAVNPSGYWCLLLGDGTGATLTDDWVFPHVAVDVMASYSSPSITNSKLTSGWSITFPTDLTNYTSLTTVNRAEA